MEITGSKYSRKTYTIFMIAAVAFAIWCFYDGYFNPEFAIEHSKMPDGRDLKAHINDHPEYSILLLEKRYSEIDLEAFQGRTDDTSLTFSKYYGPIFCLFVLIYFALRFISISKKRIVTDEKGFAFADGSRIDYENITGIDKRNFKSKGIVIISHQQGTSTAKTKLSDRIYDNLGLFLDEIVAKTGAQPLNENCCEQKS